ncbi:GntR family transcriptional regulator [Nonomuraea glycinis]|uniref:GntR family transcriptional regulator n=1 Tax=Nonomuraea glycinis TaxID=2047744 RepID=A0A918AE16_9ACTN|nr:GntR family transcriptional regulator [Nonomuraea glycinis]MCA2177595.1 GntR family transcriptional regulator [Nonomuraea glycinis]GGP17558.1 GntR family transcriptional regulator [Nonomuraea glycinis]
MTVDSTDQTPARGETRADRAYQSLRQAIGAGTLRPGQKVTERGLAEQLMVSPTPVREALLRLEHDGLIERTGPRTVVVADIAERAIDDLAEVEIGLRGLVARFAARNATPEQVDALDAILDAADDLLIVIVSRHRKGENVDRHVAALLDRMQEFNEAVNACAANPMLIRLLEQSQVFSQPERRALRLEKIAEDDHFGLDRYASHRALVRALRQGDSATAERLVIEDAQGGLAALRARPRRSDR